MTTTAEQQAAYYRYLRDVFCLAPPLREAALDALEAAFERVIGNTDPTPALIDLALQQALDAARAAGGQ